MQALWSRIETQLHFLRNRNSFLGEDVYLYEDSLNQSKELIKSTTFLTLEDDLNWDDLGRGLPGIWLL